MAPHVSQRQLADDSDAKSLKRIVALTDAVYAFSMTLLASHLDVPNGLHSGNQVNHYLFNLIPDIAVYALGFLVMGFFWYLNNRAFETIVEVDSWFIWLNILHLMTVAFMPFPTAVLGQYFLAQVPEAIALYSFSLGLLSFTFSLLYMYAAYKHRLINKKVSEATLRYQRWRGVTSWVPLFIASAAAFVSVLAAHLAWTSIVLLRIAVVKLLRPKTPSCRQRKGHAPKESSAEATYDFDRLIALSDNVYGFALTLLVIQMVVPVTVPASQLAKAIENLAPLLFSFALSFIVIGALWILHRHIFNALEKASGAFVGWNIMHLAGIAFLPFPTEMMGDYARYRTPVMLYAGVVAYVLIVQLLAIQSAHRSGLFGPQATPAFIWHAKLSHAFAAGVFLLSIPLAMTSISWTPYSWALTWPLGLVADKMADKKFAGQIAA